MSALNFSLSRKEESTWWSTTSFNEGSLNTDLALILGAMVCVLISALGLISLLRLARYYSRRTGAESSDGVAIQLVNTELKKAAIKALPVVIYTSASKMPPELATDCPICLYEFKEREKVRVLPDCNHGFHMECIDKWLISNSSCPMCRHSPNLFSRNMKPGGAAIAQDTELSNAIHVVIETTDSTRAIPGSTQALERNPQEATGATTTLPLPTSSVSENGSSPDPMNNVV